MKGIEDKIAITKILKIKFACKDMIKVFPVRSYRLYLTHNETIIQIR